MTDMTVSKTILEQLGGHKFTVMTGATHFTGSANALSFKLPGCGGFTRGGINKVTVRLNALDTYDVEFLRLRAGKSAVVAYKEGVYAEDLQATFTRETGLQVSMGTMTMRRDSAFFPEDLRVKD